MPGVKNNPVHWRSQKFRLEGAQNGKIM